MDPLQEFPPFREFPELHLRLNLMVRRLNALLPRGGPGMKVVLTSTGCSFEAEPAKTAAKTAASHTYFRVKDVKPDYLICNKVVFAGATPVADASITNIAKNWKCRTTPFNGKTIQQPSGGAVIYTYDLVGYPDGTRRLATGSGFTETQVIVPDYVRGYDVGNQHVVGDMIVAVEKPIGGTGVLDIAGLPVTWLDTNEDGRAWAEAI